MRQATFVLLAVAWTAIAAPQTRADVVFTSLGDNDEYHPNNGGLVADPHPAQPAWLYIERASHFQVSGGDFFLDGVDLPIFNWTILGGPTNSGTISIYSGAGEPTTLLESLAVADLIASAPGDDLPVLELSFDGTTLLEDGLDYWVVVQADFGTYWSWRDNSIGYEGLQAIVPNPGDPWQAWLDPAPPAMRVHGTPVPTLFSDIDEMSMQSGGTQVMDLLAGPARAGHLYLVAGSLSGTAPGLPLGSSTLPLNPDAYFSFSVAKANQAPYGNTFGMLDAGGSAQATFTLPPISPNHVGLTLHHAYGTVDPVSGAFSHTSNAVALDLVL